MGMYDVTPRQAVKLIQLDLQAGNVPFLQGSPGNGKSALIKQIAKANKLKVIDMRLSTAEPTDLTGMPVILNGRSTYCPFTTFPIESDTPPEGYDGWLLFLDEFNSAPRAVQAAAYKLILDRQVGEYNLHPNVAMCLAGNLSTDRAITNPLSTASQSRIIHYFLVPSFRDWMEDVVYADKWDMRIAAYLEWKPSRMNDFQPDHDNPTFCCPRTWEFMQNRLACMGSGPVDPEYLPAFAGTITPMIAQEFLTFSNLFGRLPDIQTIIDKPEQCGVPTERDLQFAITVAITEHVKEDTITNIVKYIRRIPGMEFTTVFLRAVLTQHPEFRHHEAIQEIMVGAATR